MRVRPTSVVNDIAELYNQYKNHCVELIDEFIQSGELNRSEGRKIQTVALFYNRYRNGGVERVISLLMPLYIEMGYRVVLITEENATSDDYEMPKGVKRYTICNTQSIANGGCDYKERAQQLVDIFECENIDVLINHASSSPIMFWDMLTAKLKGIHCILVKHELFTQENTYFQSYTKQYIEMFLLFDKIVVLSETEKMFWKVYGIEAEYIYNPINEVNQVIPMQERKNIVWVGRFDMKQKRYIDVVPIMKEVVKEYPDIKLIMYGKGSSIDKKIISEEINQSGLQDNIILAGYETSVEKIYKNARIHLVTSAFESFGMNILESRILGIPTVLYEMPYLELLKEGKGYIGVEYKDYSAAAKGIIKILSDKELEEKMSEDAIESINGFTKTDLMNRWKTLFTSLETNSCKGKEAKVDCDMARIFDVFIKHYNISREKHNALVEAYDEQTLEKLLSFVKNQKDINGRGVVIYPFGKYGVHIAKYLEKNNVTIDYVIDNNRVNGKYKIIKLEELNKYNCEDYIYILSNGNSEIYDELRDGIRKYVKPENIYDIFPEEVMMKNIKEGILMA